MLLRSAFVDFVQGLLNLDPIKRWSPDQAKLHPFITGEPFTGPWQVRDLSCLPVCSLTQFADPCLYVASKSFFLCGKPTFKCDANEGDLAFSSEGAASVRRTSRDSAKQGGSSVSRCHELQPVSLDLGSQAGPLDADKFS